MKKSKKIKQQKKEIKRLKHDVKWYEGMLEGMIYWADCIRIERDEK